MRPITSSAIDCAPLLLPLKTVSHKPSETLKSHNICILQQHSETLISDLISSSVKMSLGEVACSYSLMILHDDNIAVTGEKISTLLKAAKVEVEAYWPSLFAKLAEKRIVDDLILNAGGGGAPVAVAAPAATAGGGSAASASAAPSEEKKEEPKEESDDDMGFSLFD